MENQYSYYNSNEQQPNANQPFGAGGSPVEPKKPTEPKPKKKVPKAVWILGMALAVGLVAGGAFVTTNFIGSKLLGITSEDRRAKETKEAAEKTELSQSSSVITTDVTNVVKNVMPSLVSITNMSVQEVQSFFGGYQQIESESAGSGIIISQTDDELLMVTNNHVVEGSQTLTVTFVDGTNMEANIKGTNAECDLAVIAVSKKNISDETMDAISVATLGDSTKLNIGEPAIAIGNALGYGQSVTTGVISAVNRENTVVDEQTGQKTTGGVKLIQTDAAINPGNSGGALVNANGEVIGISSSKLAGTMVEGMGYAIPISDVSDIISELMSRETKEKVPEAQRGYLGITGFDVDAQSAERYNMPTGVYVEEVVRGGGADRAGITKGNIITGLGGVDVENMEGLQRELQYYAKGDSVSITVQIPENNGEYTEKTVEVRLGKRAE